MKSVVKYLILYMTLVACKKESLITLPGFETHQLSIVESAGLETITIDLGEGVPASTDFTITISGTAGMDGDFVVTSSADEIKLANDLTKVSSLSGSITDQAWVTYSVQAGQKTIAIPIKIINDSQIEPGYETIQLDISSVSDGSLELINKSIILIIQDDDQPQANELQIDLSWQLQSGGSINASNFDLLLAKNVKFSNGTATDYELVTDFSSAHSTGFETLLLNKDLPDGKYYVMITYVSGSSNSKVKVIISEGSSVRSAGGQIAASQVGGNFFYGPIYKSSSGFSYRSDLSEPDWHDSN